MKSQPFEVGTATYVDENSAVIKRAETWIGTSEPEVESLPCFSSKLEGTNESSATRRPRRTSSVSRSGVPGPKELFLTSRQPRGLLVCLEGDLWPAPSGRRGHRLRERRNQRGVRQPACRKI